METWLSLLRPAVQLVPSSGGTENVARLGGLPLLPDDVDWPEWPDHGPLSYIGEVRCDRLAEFSLDIDVPVRGRLLFFYFDGSFDNYASTVGTWDASTLQGTRALHISEEAACSPRSAPVGIKVYSARDFAGREIVTAPGWEHPDLEAAFRRPGQDRRSFMDHPVNADAFADALHERHVGPLHQIGGYADPVQGPVEFEVAQAAVTSALPNDDPRLSEEARRWELLFQVDTDDELGMEWGDGGVLYWMLRTDQGPDDGTKLGEVSFTWQCG